MAQISALRASRATDAPPSPSDPLHDIAERVRRLEAQFKRIDAGVAAMERDHGDRFSLTGQVCELESTLLNLASFERAASPLGAMVQIIAAKAHLDELQELTIDTDEAHEAQLLRLAVTRSLVSVMAWIERTHGLSRAAFGFDGWLPDYIDTAAALAAEEAAAGG